jgi:hypothetical protein
VHGFELLQENILMLSNAPPPAPRRERNEGKDLESLNDAERDVLGDLTDFYEMLMLKVLEKTNDVNNVMNAAKELRTTIRNKKMIWLLDLFGNRDIAEAKAIIDHIDTARSKLLTNGTVQGSADNMTVQSAVWESLNLYAILQIIHFI